MPPTVLSWLHFGDLHITTRDQANHRDMLTLVESANRNLAGRVDFALLPGDCAEHGTAEEFALVRSAMDRMAIPLRIIPGDHDFHSRTLAAFHTVLGAPALPAAATTAGVRCLFLDIVSAGTGGPDFRLGAAQIAWLEAELAKGGPAALFMHSYPADLRDGRDALTALLARHRVLAVDMGHTHYNELANDGRTIFMATRSTGQIEEGPPGFSVAAIDHGVVSWRFQPLGAAWPLVLITAPADHRLAIAPDHAVRGPFRVAAKIWGGSAITQATAQVESGAAIQLAPSAGDPALWQGTYPALPDGLHRLTVHATDEAGAEGTEALTIRAGQAGQAPARHADGSDRDALAAWPEKHILGTQLGPNRNGRKW